MPSCNVCSRDRVALLGVLIASLASVPAQAQVPVVTVAAAPAAAAMTLDQLLARFAGMSGLSARFREEKRMALLAAPLVNEGTLYFAPKGRLARHITTPAPATVLIDEGSLRYADAAAARP